MESDGEAPCNIQSTHTHTHRDTHVHSYILVYEIKIEIFVHMCSILVYSIRLIVGFILIWHGLRLPALRLCVHIGFITWFSIFIVVRKYQDVERVKGVI